MGKARRPEFSSSIDRLKVHARGSEVIPDLLRDRSTGVALEDGNSDGVELSGRRRLTRKVRVLRKSTAASDCAQTCNIAGIISMALDSVRCA